MRSAIEIICRPCSAAKRSSSGIRAIVPSSFVTSASTPDGKQPGQAGEVDRGLGVAGALEHAALAVAQREDVPGAGEVVGRARRVDERAHGRGAVGGRDAGRRAVPGVDGHGERGALDLGVVRHHQRQLELVEPLAFERQADHAAGVADHERDRLGRHLLRRHDEVALVLTVGVVDHDHQLTARDRVDGVLDLGERHPYFASCGSRPASLSTYLAIRSTSTFTACARLTRSRTW